MPLKLIDINEDPGRLLQVCARCAREHVIRFDRGAATTRVGPFPLAHGDVLDLTVNGGQTSVTFDKAQFADIARATPEEVAARLATLQGILAFASAGAVVLESATAGAGSQVDVVGGTARKALGFLDDGRVDLVTGRPVLGLEIGGRGLKDVIALRRCACGASETLLRTWDTAPAGYANSSFAKHRRAVNALAQHFRARGWLHPSIATEVQAEASVPPDADDLTATKRIVVTS